ncbi:MAG TPA: aromatic ring-hydroxylating dioxygenase subunit alpha [Pseudonocardia sp.]
MSTDTSHDTTHDTETMPVSAEVRESMHSAEYYLRQDRGHIPDALFEQSTKDLGNEPLDKSVFVRREFHEVEKTRLWKRVWQMACRENDIPEVGDRVVYDIIDQSIVLVRSAPDEIKAFHNTCMHRGTRLVAPEVGDPTSGKQFTCSFHKWSYNLDGSIKQIPCRWDFPAVRDEQVHLSEVQVGTWNGWVFINMDPRCQPFEEFLGETIPRHFLSWPRERTAKVAHIGKVIPCNWKLAAEAFLEIYHIVATHPNFLPYSADCNAQYDFWGLHARMLGIVGVPSPHLGEIEDPQMIVDGMLGDAVGNMFGESEFDMPQLAEGATEMDARQLCADFVRQAMGAQFGVDFSGASDSEMLDATQYFMFPNFIPWAGNAFPINYRVRPNGDDHESSIFEVLVLSFMPEGAQLPKDSQLKMTPPDEPWGAVPELGGLGPIVDQDMVNLVKFQRGIKSDGITHVQLANYQERNIRNLHQNLERFVRE